MSTGYHPFGKTATDGKLLAESKATGFRMVTQVNGNGTTTLTVTSTTALTSGAKQFLRLSVTTP